MKITRGQSQARRARKTVTFDGLTLNGLVNENVTLFTLTGRVWVKAMTIFCTETLAGATATVSLGTASGVANLIGATTATTIAANDWWGDTSPAEIGILSLEVTAPVLLNFVLSESPVIAVATQNVTDGTLVIDCWYEPITDNGFLA